MDKFREVYHAPAEADAPAAAYVWMFPNITLHVDLGHMQTIVILPMGHDRHRAVFDGDPSNPPVDTTGDPAWTKLLAFTADVPDEDIEICVTVQRNPRSRACERDR